MKKLSPSDLLALTICTIPLTGFSAESKTPAQLPDVTVTAKMQDSLTVDGNATAIKEIKKTAGGFAVVEGKDFENKYTFNLQDAFREKRS